MPISRLHSREGADHYAAIPVNRVCGAHVCPPICRLVVGLRCFWSSTLVILLITSHFHHAPLLFTALQNSVVLQSIVLIKRESGEAAPLGDLREIRSSLDIPIKFIGHTRSTGIIHQVTNAAARHGPVMRDETPGRVRQQKTV